VKNDFRDAADLADLLRIGRLPEAWRAPVKVRDQRELVRQRCSSRPIDAIGAEVDRFDRLIRSESGADAGYRVIQQLPGVSPTIAAVLVAELGDKGVTGHNY
jgi:hypothetical protein